MLRLRQHLPQVSDPLLDNWHFVLATVSFYLVKVSIQMKPSSVGRTVSLKTTSPDNVFKNRRPLSSVPHCVYGVDG
jgi:hypothetical protein